MKRHMSKRFVRQGLAVLCTVALLSQGVTGSVLAHAEGTEEYVPFEKFPAPTIVEEIVEQREPSAKYFRRSDGSITAVYYNDVVHYEEDGALKDVDNTLIAAIDQNGDLVYTNTDNALSVAFPSALTADSPVTVTHDGYTVSWVMEGQAALAAARASDLAAIVPRAKQPKTKAQQQAALSARLEKIADRDERTKLENEEKTTLHKFGSSVSYDEAAGVGATIQYDVQGTKLKESIVFESLPRSRSYSYLLTVGELTPVLNADKSVDLYANGETEPVLRIAAPVMWDAAYESSNNIEVFLRPVQGQAGVYRYMLRPDWAWLSSADREYPVTLDPTVDATTNSFTDFYDTYVSSNGTTSTAAANGQFLKVGEENLSSADYVSYIKPLPVLGIPSRLITEATLSLKIFLNINNSGTYPALNLAAVNSDITGGITWTTQPSYTAIANNIMPTNDEANNPDRYEFDVLQTVAEWISGKRANHGFRVYYNDGCQSGVVFSSSDATADRPVLTISYFIPTTELDEGTYYIQGVNNKYMDVDGATATNGAFVRTQAFSGNNDQRFCAQKQSDGTYAFQSATNKTMYLSQYNNTDADLMSLMTTTSTTWNRWYLYETAYGYLIRPKCSTTRVLDVYGMPTNDYFTWNSDITSFEYQGGYNQFWNFKKAGTVLTVSREEAFLKPNNNEDEDLKFRAAFLDDVSPYTHWSTEDTDIIEINGGNDKVVANNTDVIITPKAYGKATITVRSLINDFSKTITVYVRDYDVPVVITFDGACEEILDDIFEREDNQTSDDFIKESISKLVQPAYDKYLTDFGVHMYTQSILFKVFTLPSDCTIVQYGDKNCNCITNDQCGTLSGENSLYHHDSLKAMREDLKTYKTEGALNLGFTGRDDVCSGIRKSTHMMVSDGAWGNCLPGDPYIIVRLINDEQMQSEVSLLKDGFFDASTFNSSTVFHEMGHAFGITDHYTQDLGAEKNACCWGKDFLNKDILSTRKVCTDCRNTIFNGRSSLLVEG